MAKRDEWYLQAKSIHVFGWPFRICEEDKEKFVKKIKAKGWTPKPMDYKKMDSPEEFRDAFMLNQYLSASARDIFMQPEKDICEIFEFPMDPDGTYIYEIKCADQKEYRLPIAAIELHVYHFGVGILFIHALNGAGREICGKEPCVYESIEDIKRINDRGRRVMLPYIPADLEKGTILCAEQLGIRTETNAFMTDFRKMVREIDRSGDREKLARPADFLYALLNNELGGDDKRRPVKVEPFTDDRMFVACLIRDNKISEAIKTDSFDCSDEFRNLLYSIVYVDDGAASCQNKQMRDSLLDECVYSRWSGYGTLWAATSYSMMCVTSSSPGGNDAVVRPFYVEYLYLVSLVLAQRIGIAQFSAMAGTIVHGVDKKGNIKSRQVKELINLQEQYITFKNQLLILEASNQEQGIELYRMLVKQMLVEEEKSILDEQLESLYEVTNVSNGNKLNVWGLRLAVGAIVIDIIVQTIFYLLG